MAEWLPWDRWLQRNRLRAADWPPGADLIVLDAWQGLADWVEDVLPHGEPSTYTNHRCRCQACRAAWSQYRKDQRRRQKAAP